MHQESGQVRKGLRLSFYRDADGMDCTMGGISARFTRCTLVGIVRYPPSRQPTFTSLPNDCQVFTPTADAPAVWLVMDKHRRGDRFIIPADATGGPDLATPWMDGGNFAADCDSRFTELTGTIMGVRVHDRNER